MFISSQLGQRTPCLLHVSVSFGTQAPVAIECEQPASMDYDEPFAFGQLRPTVDRPGPFTIREYVRLQLLRSRVQAEASALDAPARRAIAHSLSPR
jgi:hypothetical protein